MSRLFFQGNYTDSESVQNMTAEQKEIWDKMFFCFEDIHNILRGMIYHADNIRSIDGDIKIAAYLLFVVSTYNDPFSISFSDLKEMGIDEEIITLAERYHIDTLWGFLLKLIKDYSPNIFKLVTVLENPSNPNKSPEGVVDLATELLDIQGNESFADLCCGAGNVAKLVKKCSPTTDVFGFDIDTDFIAVAKAENAVKKTQIQYFAQDVFELGLQGKNKPRFQKIFANYPFGARLISQSVGKDYLGVVKERIPSFARATSTDWLYNCLMIDLLSENGKAIGIMTNGSTWNQLDAPIRKYFVENGFVESVIALPAKLFAMTSISTSMIVLSHGNKSVRLIDATSLFQQGRRENEMTEEHVAAVLDAVKNDCDISITVSLDELRNNDYMLNAGRYIQNNNSISNGIPFGQVIKRITRGASINASDLDKMTTFAPTAYQYLMCANIQNGIIDRDLPYLTTIDKRNEKYCLTNHCLLLSKNGAPYKVAVAETEPGKKILANGNLYLIEIDETVADPYYIASFLCSAQGTVTLKSISVGAAVPNIGVDQLKKMIIPLPEMEKQKEIGEQYLTIRDEMQLLLIKLEKAKARMANLMEEVEE